MLEDFFALPWDQAEPKDIGFAVRDPDGHVLGFGEVLAPPA